MALTPADNPIPTDSLLHNDQVANKQQTTQQRITKKQLRQPNDPATITATDDDNDDNRRGINDGRQTNNERSYILQYTFFCSFFGCAVSVWLENGELFLDDRSISPNAKHAINNTQCC